MRWWWLIGIVLACRTAAADSGELLRVALLPKVSLAGRTQAHAALEAALVRSLAAKGARIVDIAQATEAQRLAWSDRVQAGQLPEGTNLLFVDALYSAQLDCWQSASQVQGTSLVAVQCALSSKIVRVDSGDVVF